MAKEILQEIDVEKPMYEDFDEMILETDVDGDVKAQWSRSWAQSDPQIANESTPMERIPERVGVRCRNRQASSSTRRRLHRAQDQEDGDFYSHKRLVCVPETCDVRTTVVTILKEIGGVCCLRNPS